MPPRAACVMRSASSPQLVWRALLLLTTHAGTETLPDRDLNYQLYGNIPMADIIGGEPAALLQPGVGWSGSGRLEQQYNYPAMQAAARAPPSRAFIHAGPGAARSHAGACARGQHSMSVHRQNASWH